MRAIHSLPFLCDLLVDDQTGDHYVDVLGGGRGAYVTRVRISTEEAYVLRKNPRMLEEFAMRVSEVWCLDDARLAG